MRDRYMTRLLKLFLLGDFNVKLLNYNEHNQTNEFLDSLASNSFMPIILEPTRITSHSYTDTISYHLPQFSIIPNMFGNISGNKSYIYGTDPNLMEKIF